MSYTFVELEISAAAYDEIASRLRAADYGHVFVKDGLMDMHGIALSRAADKPNPAVADDLIITADGRALFLGDREVT